MKLIPLILFLCVSLNLYGKTGSVTGFEIPRFVSLKSNDVISYYNYNIAKKRP